MKKILAVGNSFSENATHFLHQVAASAGVDTKVVNLNIGGCPLEKHWKNIQEDNVAYRFELNGYWDEESKQHPVSIAETLQTDDWDFVVSQQASGDSGISDLYYPFAHHVFSYLRANAPAAQLFIQQTWAYETDSEHYAFPRYDNDQLEMYTRLTKCYQSVARELDLTIIPTGEVIQGLRQLPLFAEKKIPMSTDGHHVSDTYGKYAVALVWFKYLLGGDVNRVTFVPEITNPAEEPIKLAYLAEIKKFVAEFDSTVR